MPKGKMATHIFNVARAAGRDDERLIFTRLDDRGATFVLDEDESLIVSTSDGTEQATCHLDLAEAEQLRDFLIRHYGPKS